jgi:hypothetical protein
MRLLVLDCGLCLTQLMLSLLKILLTMILLLQGTLKLRSFFRVSMLLCLLLRRRILQPYAAASLTLALDWWKEVAASLSTLAASLRTLTANLRTLKRTRRAGAAGMQTRAAEAT